MTKRASERKDLAERFSQFLKQEYGYDLDTTLKKIAEKPEESREILLPISTFATTLSTLEAAIRYLKEVRGLPFIAIGKLLNRHPASLTTSYRRSLIKDREPFTARQLRSSVIKIPLKIFSARKLAPLEALVWYLSDDLGLRPCDIARLLHKDQRTVWTVKNRATKKLKEVGK